MLELTSQRESEKIGKDFKYLSDIFLMLARTIIDEFDFLRRRKKMLELTSQSEFEAYKESEKIGKDFKHLSDIFFNFDLTLETTLYFSHCKFRGVIPAVATHHNSFIDCEIDQIRLDNGFYNITLLNSTVERVVLCEAHLSKHSLISQNKIESFLFIRSSMYSEDFYRNVIDQLTVSRGTLVHFPPVANNNFVTLGVDIRGYTFLLKIDSSDEKVHIIHAGCRTFTLPEATQHWNNQHEDNSLLQSQIFSFLNYAHVILETTALGEE